MKLTKTQKARAKRAVKADIRMTLEAGIIGVRGCWFWRQHPEYRECEHLLKVALRAVERDRG